MLDGNHWPQIRRFAARQVGVSPDLTILWPSVRHFGPGLKRFVLAQYHQGQTTMPRLAALLQGLGLDISKRQLVRLHNAGQEAFLSEAREVLRTGLQAASWIAVVLEARLRHDDTGARHKAQNGVCTQLGNDAFTAFVTTGSKSRLNFLELLNARRSCAIRRQWWPGPPCHRVG